MKRMRGSVALEAVLALSLVVVPAVALHLEATRVVLNRIVLHASAFQFVRHRALGSSRTQARAAANHRYAEHFLELERRQLRHPDHWESGLHSSLDEVWGRVSVRYSSWFARIQVTEKCRFFW